MKQSRYSKKIVAAFSGRTAIVTGGASGMGRSLCLHLGLMGCRVFVADINAGGAAETASLIEQDCGEALAMELDVTDADAVDAAIHRVLSRWNRLDYYFNNAGIGVSAEMQDISTDLWKKVVDINLMGVIHGTRMAYSVMLEQGYGHIVNVASMAGLAPFPINIPYTASKFGVVGLTRAMQAEAAGRGIAVSLVCPGIVKTNFYRDIEVVNINRAEYTGRLPSRLMTPDRAAMAMLRGVAARKKLILFPFHARLVYYAYRFIPELFIQAMRFIAHEFRKLKK
jgi:NAD(P)-dependent dehydrogenase (short-subunit alcohol dehydrogenase family)